LTILSIDTFDQATGAAVWSDGEILAERNVLRSKDRDFLLTAIVDSLCGSAGIKLKDIDGIAICQGPGSFTGLRVGCAYAKGLCSALNLPLSAVSSLETLAYSAGYSQFLIVPMIKAQGAEVYNAGFKYIDGALQELYPRQLQPASEAAERFTEPFISLGSGYRRNRATIVKSAGKLLVRYNQPEPESTARIIAHLGAERIKNRKTENLMLFEPEYLQNFPQRV